jgi:hypothetical protein
MERPSLLLRLTFVAALSAAAVACGGRAADTSPAPSRVTLDPSTCEASLETLVTIDGAAWALAAAPNGTVYFAQSEPAAASGVYAMAPGEAPARIAEDNGVLQLLVDGTDLLVVEPHGIRRLPMSGGPSVPFVTAATSEMITAARLDASHLYFGVQSNAASTFTLERMLRQGGDAQTVFSAQKDFFGGGSFVMGDLDVFITGMDMNVYGVPKTGGSPSLLHAHATVSLLVAANGEIFSDQPLGPPLRSTVDPGAAPTPIAWPDHSSLVSYGGAPGNAVADDATAYFAFEHYDDALTQNVAFARLPGAGETVAVTACTEASDAPEVPAAMALDATHVYAMLTSFDGKSARIVRMPR